jgi:hypothetical protein
MKTPEVMPEEEREISYSIHDFSLPGHPLSLVTY